VANAPYKESGWLSRAWNSVKSWISEHADGLERISTVLKGVSAMLGVLPLVPGLQFLASFAMAAGPAWSPGEDEPMTTDWPASFEEALAAAEPTLALREAVVQARTAGVERNAVERQLRALREHLQRPGRDADEDVVLEVMDFLAGWSSPHMKID
jgi:hypothetical protein